MPCTPNGCIPCCGPGCAPVCCCPVCCPGCCWRLRAAMICPAIGPYFWTTSPTSFAALVMSFHDGQDHSAPNCCSVPVLIAPRFCCGPGCVPCCCPGCAPVCCFTVCCPSCCWTLSPPMICPVIGPYFWT